MTDVISFPAMVQASLKINTIKCHCYFFLDCDYMTRAIDQRLLANVDAKRFQINLRHRQKSDGFLLRSLPFCQYLHAGTVHSHV